MKITLFLSSPVKNKTFHFKHEQVKCWHAYWSCERETVQDISKIRNPVFIEIKCYALNCCKMASNIFGVNLSSHSAKEFACSFADLLGNKRIGSQYIIVYGSQWTSQRKPRSTTHLIYRKRKTSSTAKHHIDPFNKRYQYLDDLINTYITKVKKVTMVRWGSSKKHLSCQAFLGVWARETPLLCSSLHPPTHTFCDLPAFHP